MGEHELPEPRRDPAKTIEIKVVAATVGGLLASVAYAVLDALARDQHMLDSLPELWRFLVLAAIPPLLTFLLGWAVPSNRV